MSLKLKHVVTFLKITVSFIVVKIMLFLATRVCHEVLRQCFPKYFAFYPWPITAILFLYRPTFQLDIWPRGSPNFGSFGHSPPLCIHRHFQRVWSDCDWNYLARLVLIRLGMVICLNHDSHKALSDVKHVSFIINLIMLGLSVSTA